ncbi:hypothetical protein GTO91_16475 [Heliobacterium undosum]|uniref:SMODS-associating 2TM beta-strand rich effector domain-containing protein n=1 Tax=Heliomicrobium undosum TaxID=121734 RepID=A0A845L945_9FIRM|nr:hypothetical protein [Heliomicrobium undosum]MZP31304.1 hypothetical protein [Heliomicrobium undosum]
MERVLPAAFGGIVGLLVTLIHDHLLTKTLSWPISASLFGALSIGAILLFVYELISNSAGFLRLTSPISRVEGAWAITIMKNGNRPESVCKIYLSHGRYIYTGYGISADGLLGSEWTSRDVHYDKKIDELSFTADATMVGTGKRIRNYGYIKFYKDAKGKYTYGYGYFVDMADELNHYHMKLTRISDEQFDEKINKVFNNVSSQIALDKRVEYEQSTGRLVPGQDPQPLRQ